MIDKCRTILTSEGALRIFRVGVLMVTNSSAAVGWIPIVASKSALVRPAFTAIANPWNPNLKMIHYTTQTIMSKVKYDTT